MRNRKVYGLGIGLLSMAALSCNHIKEEAGPLTVEERQLTEGFHEIHMKGSMDIELVEGQAYDIKIEAGSYIMDEIITDVQSGTLHLYETAKGNHKIKAYVNIESLDKIELSGSGDITGVEIETESFELYLKGSGDIKLPLKTQALEVHLDGSGDIDLYGTTNRLEAELDGSGDLDFKDMTSQIAEVNIEGSGDCKLWVEDELYARVRGSGDIQYWGDPETVHAEVKGSGDIIGMN